MPKVWITRDGQRIKIKDLKDDHLCNILRYVKRNAEKAQNVAFQELSRAERCLQGEMALMAAESELVALGELDWFEFIETDDSELFDTVQELLLEVSKRGLNWEI